MKKEMAVSKRKRSIVAKNRGQENLSLFASEELEVSLHESIKFEKNLASLGFFTPSNKKIKNVKERELTFTNEVDGKKVVSSVRIIPSTTYGLPVTADQDTFFAILKIATDIYRKQGKLANPIGFTFSEILQIQEKSTAGYHYKELKEQLMRIKTTTISSEGAVYLAGKKVWAKDAFNIFDRVVFLGNKLDDGSIADKNYIWFAQWQLENINNNYLLPIDYEIYKKLKNSIAKALQPLLQLWLTATWEQGFFEKPYDEICQILDIRQYQHKSEIQRKLGPSLNEFKKYGYLSKWKVEDLDERKNYKIVFYHGEIFYRDRAKIVGRDSSLAASASLLDSARVVKGGKAAAGEQTPLLTGQTERLAEMLVARGANRRWAEGYLRKSGNEMLGKIKERIEYFDWLMQQGKARVKAPGGYLRSMIEDMWELPAEFLASRARAATVEKVKKPELPDLTVHPFAANDAYLSWWNGKVDAAMAKKSEKELTRLEMQIKEELDKKLSTNRLTLKQKRELVQQTLRQRIAQELHLIGFSEWCQQLNV
jgi:hypothetical protein